MANVLEALIYASERAACVARSCAASLSDENLVVTEKCGDEANSRFEHDFKTIADVLAQEAAKVEIGRHCRELSNNVWGEECGEINGHAIKVKENVHETALLLGAVVPKEQAEKLAEGSHCELNPKLVGEFPFDLPEIDDATLGVWIDPIDATAEFIAGVKSKGETNGESGLPCVTVLVGAFVKATGEPVMGVVNQPFYNNTGRILWGVSYSGYGKVGGCEMPKTHNENTVLVSGAENVDIIETFKSSGWEVKSARGCGHKLLKVALGDAAGYFVTKGTTFQWDTCAAHAILKAKGGDILSFATLNPVSYTTKKSKEEQAHCHADGVIAYCHPKVLYGMKIVLNKI